MADGERDQIVWLTGLWWMGDRDASRDGGSVHTRVGVEYGKHEVSVVPNPSLTG